MSDYGFFELNITTRMFGLLPWPTVTEKWEKWGTRGNVERYAQTLRDCGAVRVTIRQVSPDGETGTR
jgi:hypothetical protein